MLTELQLYWITRLDNICSFVECWRTAALLMLLFSCIAIIILLIAECIMKMDAISFCGADRIMEDASYASISSIRKCVCNVVLKCILPLFMLIYSAHIFIPTTKEYCAIKVVPAIVNNEKTLELTDELYSLGIEWLKELKPAKSASTNMLDSCSAEH